MRTRGDFTCLHEPFGLAYYTGTDRRTPKPEAMELDSDRSYASTYKDILDARTPDKRVFIKDFPNYINWMADDAFLDAFQHTFLIRHPRKALASMYHNWDEFTMDEAGFEDLRVMFDAVVDRYGEIPPVIDSDDLLSNPEGTVRAYCEGVGIEFLPHSLEWEEGEREEVRWFPDNWHGNLMKSTKLGDQKTKYRAQIEDVPFLQDMYAQCMPHFEVLHQHKLEPH